MTKPEDQKRADELIKSIRTQIPSFGNLPKAKTAKLIRDLIDELQAIPNAESAQMDICKELIDWAAKENRIYLRQMLETRMVALYIKNKKYAESLALIATLLKELKRLDDKTVLMDVQLLESKTYYALRNMTKSRAALTSARTSANAIYCPPLTQAELDMQSGILHAEDKDYKTAFSYFFETLEAYMSQDDPRAVMSLKYMLLCKIMLNAPEDVHSLLHGKYALKHQSSKELEAMKAVAQAHQNRNLAEFEDALKRYSNQLSNDPIIGNHLASLYDNLLEQHLLRVIEPFSRVEIAHIAELVTLPAHQVEEKLSQMILDKVFKGILDQNAGCLEIFEDTPADETYTAALDVLKGMNSVVESLYEKASKLT